MKNTSTNSISSAVAIVIVLATSLGSPTLSYAGKKKTDAPPPHVPAKVVFDTSKLVWPSPPSAPRIRYLAYYAGVKLDYTQQQAAKKKQSWMDRLAGAQAPGEKVDVKNFPFQLLGPYGIAIDSKGQVYVADQKVGAIFIFNTETGDVQLIRNGFEAHFGLVNGLAIDDDDRLFVSDGKMRRILVFNAQREIVGQIADNLVDPVGLALDTQNRFLYVVDTQADQVVVFDADSLKELRRIGTTGKNHFLTTPGDFALPTNVALDQEGNVYVTDTFNNRVEIFDADGKFISQFGKHGDGPGYFARPKGIAVDSDGHVWVADSYTDRLQVFDRDGQLLTFLGGHGHYPGQFEALMGLAIDKNNRVFTTEQYPGRLQSFRYISDAEAVADKARKQAADQKSGDTRKSAAAQPSTQVPAAQ